MVGRPPVRDDRAVSEATGMAILIVFTFLVTASVGVGVLFFEGEGSSQTSANFSFEYRSSSSMLLVTHERGDEFPAGSLLLEGSPGTVTWATVANANDNESIGPGDLIQLSPSSAWGDSVGPADTVEIYYDPGDGNRTLLDYWEGA